VRATDAAGNVDGTPATRSWTITNPPDTGTPGGDQQQLPQQQQPGQQQQPTTPQSQACRFAAPGPGCGPAKLTVSLTPKKAGKSGNLKVTADGKGVELKSAVIQLPKGVALKAAKKARGKKVGTLSFTTPGSAGAIAPATLKLPKRGAATVLNAGGVKVVLKTGSTGRITITGLPQNVTGVTVALSGSRTGLVTTPKKCGTLDWKATLTDRDGGTAAPTTSAVLCKSRRSGR
jgi:hypothetical protein